MDEPFETLLSAAVRAPSGDNTQPWRFVIDRDGLRVLLYVDNARDPSPMNANQCMSRMAVGAALENMLRVVQANGWSACLEPPPEGAMAVLRVTDFRSEGRWPDTTITDRVTNRRCYDRRPVPSEQIAQLHRDSQGMEGVHICWIHDRSRLDALASLIGLADALMLSEPSMRRAFLANVRFDLPPNSEAEEYLPLGSLELPLADRLALRALPRIPDWLLRVGGARRRFAASARRLVQSASGLCMIVTDPDLPTGELLAGRVLQRAWLALTATGLAVQPMMSLVIMENILRYGTLNLLAALGRQNISDLVAKLRGLVPEIGCDRLAFIMRFGFATPPSVRTGRRPLGACTFTVRA